MELTANRFSMADLLAKSKQQIPHDSSNASIVEDANIWNYTSKGPSRWCEDFPNAKGQLQSPINIDIKAQIYDEKLAENPFDVKYVYSRVNLVTNTGNTIKVSAGERSVIKGGPLEYEYELLHFTFHWGKNNSRGSEHTVIGKQFPMEIQLLHWNTTLYKSAREAMSAPHGLAIITVFVQIGLENSEIKTVVDAIDEVRYKDDKFEVRQPINPNQLIPREEIRDYWTYEGSLTVPPCTENVTWIVFRYPISISDPQLKTFRSTRAYYRRDRQKIRSDNGPLFDNFRPVQPAQGRILRASFDSDVFAPILKKYGIKLNNSTNDTTTTVQ